MAEQNDKTSTFSERCSNFLTQHRKAIAFILALVCAAVAIALIASSIRSRTAKNASIQTEAIISEWMDIRIKNAKDKDAREAMLIEKLEKQAVANGNTYAAFRAYTTLGEIYSLRKDWEKALGCYQKAGATLPDAYTAGIAYFNAGACADELKQYEKALEFYTLSAASDDFPLKPRALFNVGRLEENLSHKDKAVAAYTNLIALYPDNDWALLAKSRVIALSIH